MLRSIFITIIIFFILFVNISYSDDNKNEIYIFKNIKWGISSREIVHKIEKDKQIDRGYFDENNNYIVCFDDNIFENPCKLIYTFNDDKLVKIIIIFIKFNNRYKYNEFFNYLNSILNKKYEINKDIISLTDKIKYYKTNNTYITLLKFDNKISVSYTEKRYEDECTKLRQDKIEEKIKQRELIREKDQKLF